MAAGAGATGAAAAGAEAGLAALAGAAADAGLAAEAAATGAAAGAAGAAADAGLTALAAPTGSAIAGLAALAPPVTGALAVPRRFRSAMFLFSSATREAASLAARSRAILSSTAGALPCTAPLDRVSLSGVAAPGFFSSTLAWTLPDAWRSEVGVRDVGTPSASLRRNSLKSRLWATTVWRASSADTAVASSPVGTSSTEPALSLFTLPPMNASGLARSMATSIWSSEMFAGLFADAIRPAVSPACTVTCLLVPAPDGRGVAACRGWAAGARAGCARPALAGAGDCACAGGGRAVRAAGAAGVTCAANGACWRDDGGSNSIV